MGARHGPPGTHPSAQPLELMSELCDPAVMAGGQYTRYIPIEGRIIPRRPRRLPTHCWVTDCPAAPGRHPGILLNWRKRPEGWQGFVVVAVGSDDDPAVLTLWLPGDYLQPR